MKEYCACARQRYKKGNRINRMKWTAINTKQICFKSRKKNGKLNIWSQRLLEMAKTSNKSAQIPLVYWCIITEYFPSAVHHKKKRRETSRREPIWPFALLKSLSLFSGDKSRSAETQSDRIGWNCCHNPIVYFTER